MNKFAYAYICQPQNPIRKSDVQPFTFTKPLSWTKQGGLQEEILIRNASRPQAVLKTVNVYAASSALSAPDRQTRLKQPTPRTSNA